MNIEDCLENCKVNQKQIQRFNPDPFYVNHFFKEFLNSVHNTLNAILEEANRDFGLFILGDISQKKFNEKAKEKNDQKALKFFNWYESRLNQQNQNSYSYAIQVLYNMRRKGEKLPKIRTMMRAKEIYKDDIYQEIKIKLKNEKLFSKEFVDIEMRRQIPIFVEIINHKRMKKNEPKVGENQVIVSTFIKINEDKTIEVGYSTEIYLKLLNQFVDESRIKIQELSKRGKF